MLKKKHSDRNAEWPELPPLKLEVGEKCHFISIMEW